jgi:serine/threonine-protein kinase PpkA
MSAPTPNADRPTAIVPGFQIERKLAEGGMATVYLANQLSLDRRAALKILTAFDDLDHKARFFNESRIIGSLNHRNIITIYDVGEVSGRAFISMEYLNGGDLASRIEAGCLDPCEALEIAAGIGDGLAFAHEQGIVHRDVKPANILFHRDGTPILSDFGIATDVKLDARLTACGTTVGSPCYVSPEQAQGTATDGRTDVYSLGVVLYEMLVGQPPFEESSAIETMAAQITVPPPCLPERLQACQPLLDRMLAKSAEERFQSAGEMVDAIRNVQINLGRASAPITTSPTRRSTQRLTLRLIRSTGQTLRASLTLLSVSGAATVQFFRHRPKAGRFAALALLVAVGWFALDGVLQPGPVRDYLRQAEAEFDEDHLAYPRRGSAVFYYRQVLTLDPDNDDALDGLHEIAEIYADRADQSLAAHEFSSAKTQIDRGIKAEPGNARLQKLLHETRSLRSLPEKVVRGIKSIFD